MVASELGVGGKTGGREGKELLAGTEIFITLFVVMVSCVYTCVKTLDKLNAFNTCRLLSIMPLWSGEGKRNLSHDRYNHRSLKLTPT